MKRLLLCLFFLLFYNSVWGYGIVVNTATRDTLVLPCQPLDSLGSPTNLVANDSVYIIVYYPGGGEAFRDSMAWNDASIKRLGWEDYAECSTYSYMERVSVLDGSGGVDGVYTWMVMIDDNTSADLQTMYTGQFQVVNATLESLLDSAGLAAKDVQNIDAWDPILDNDSLIIDQSSIEDLALASRSKIGDTSSGVDEVFAEVENLDAWNPITDNDSLIIDQSTIEDMTVATVTSVTNEVTADMTKISGDATAANNFETMLDGTGGQTFSLGRLAIRASGNDTAFIATSPGVGPGGIFYGAYGLICRDGGSTGSIKLEGGGKITDGTNNVFMTNNYEDLFDEISTGCIVEDSTGNTTTRVQTNLAEATDDHYNGAMIFFIDGTEAGTYRRITDYDGTNGYIVFDPALTGTPAAGDSMRVMPWASVSASATISDADMAAIADTILNADTAGHNGVVGSYGEILAKPAYVQGSASGLSVENIWDNVSIRAVIEDSTGNTTTMAQTNLAEATDDHFNGMAVVFISGNEEYQARRITDYNGTNGYLIWDGALTGIPASGDSLRIMRWSTVSASASLPDSTLGDISDLANKKVAVVPIDTNANGDTLAVVGTNQIMGLRGLHIRGTTGNDTAFIADGYGDGWGGMFRGGATGGGLYVKGSAGWSGMYCLGGATGGTGFKTEAQGAGHGFYAIGGSTDGDGIRATGGGAGEGAFFYGGATSGHGLYAVGQASGYGAFFFGGATNAPGLYARGNGSGAGIYARAGATGKDIYLGVSGSISDGTDDVLMTNNVWRNEDTTHVDSSDIGKWLTNNLGNAIGTGIDTIDYYAVDTSGTNDSINGVTIWTKTWGGNEYTGGLLTNAQGYIKLVAQTNDTLRVYSYKLGYAWEVDTLIFAGQGSDSTMGYNIAIGTAGGDSTTRMYGYIQDVGAGGLGGVVPKAIYVSSSPIYDTINEVYIVNQWFEGTASDTTGKWFIDIKHSNVLYNGKSNPIKAIINLEYPSGMKIEAYRDTVPADVDSFRVTRY